MDGLWPLLSAQNEEMTAPMTQPRKYTETIKPHDRRIFGIPHDTKMGPIGVHERHYALIVAVESNSRAGVQGYLVL